MEKRIYEHLEIKDLKDMLNKTRKLFGEKTAYKIKIEQGKYRTITHKEVRDMVDALRNSINKYRTKRKKNSNYRRK